MSVPLTTNNYVVGKGKVYIDRFLVDRTPTGNYKYLGNTPSFEFQRTVTALDHWDSDNGTKIKDEAFDLEMNILGKYTCDNITSDNLAMFVGGSSSGTVAQVALGSAVSEIHVLPTFEPTNTFFKLGQSPTTPLGVTNATSIVVTAGTTTLALGTDYTVDLNNGMVQILPGTTNVTAGESLTVAYNLAAASVETVNEMQQTIYGAIMFVATNPTGLYRDAFFPYCKISSDTAFAMKGDTWQTMGFSFESLLLQVGMPRVTITKRQ